MEDIEMLTQSMKFIPKANCQVEKSMGWGIVAKVANHNNDTDDQTSDRPEHEILDLFGKGRQIPEQADSSEPQTDQEVGKGIVEPSEKGHLEVNFGQHPIGGIQIENFKQATIGDGGDVILDQLMVVVHHRMHPGDTHLHRIPQKL